jgi:hypothetical protein
MKTSYYLTIITLVCFISLCITDVNAQVYKSLDDTPHDISYYRMSMVAKPLIKVIYGRPRKNGKEIFGNKVAYGKLWRTGANEATEVKFYEDVEFGGQKVAAGTYVLYTIPGEKEWEIILSSNLDVLGAFQYNPIFDIARVKVKTNNAEELESFSIFFREKKDAIHMVLGWDTTRIKIPIALKEKKEYAKL